MDASLPPLTDRAGTPGYALDLSQEGVGLYAFDSAGWHHLQTIPLQIGTVARSMAALHACTGAAAGTFALVEVWLPSAEITPSRADLSDPVDREDRRRAAYADHPVPFDDLVIAEGGLADGLTLLAAVPRQVLDEAEAFLATHSFAVAAFRAEAPAGFGSAPAFPAALARTVAPARRGGGIAALVAARLGWMVPGAMIAAAALVMAVGLMLSGPLFGPRDAAGLPDRAAQAMAPLYPLMRPEDRPHITLPAGAAPPSATVAPPPQPALRRPAQTRPAVAAPVQTAPVSVAVAAPPDPVVIGVETRLPGKSAPHAAVRPTALALAGDLARLSRFDGIAQSNIGGLGAAPLAPINAVSLTPGQGAPARMATIPGMSARDPAFSFQKMSGAVQAAAGPRPVAPLPVPGPTVAAVTDPVLNQTAPRAAQTTDAGDRGPDLLLFGPALAADASRPGQSPVSPGAERSAPRARRAALAEAPPSLPRLPLAAGLAPAQALVALVSPTAPGAARTLPPLPNADTTPASTVAPGAIASPRRPAAPSPFAANPRPFAEGRVTPTGVRVIAAAPPISPRARPS
ncbi:MAG: hypothetical protein AAF281_13565, partial [Pseudomonadota bacterium]